MRLAPLAALLAVLPALALAADGPFPLNVRVGQGAAICKTGTILCPAGGAMCDDPKVAVPELGPDGVEFKGVGPGSTLCSAGTQEGRGPRVVYRVTVSAAPAPDKAKPAGGKGG